MYNRTLPSSVNLRSGVNTQEKIKRWLDLSIGIIVVLFNIVEIVLIARTSKKKIYERILLSLSVADSLFGVSNIIVCVMFLFFNSMRDVLQATYTTYFFFVTTSILHLLFIGIDRVVLIVKPIKHNIFMTNKNLYRILALIWIVSTVTTLGLHYGFTPSNENNDNLLPRRRKFNITNKSMGESSRVRPPRPRTIMARDNTTLGRDPKELFDYKATMQGSLSYILIVSHVVLITLYTFVIYKMIVNKTSTNDKRARRERNIRISLICVFVAGIFVAFTLPYAVHSLVKGVASFWPNMLLVSNSALNSAVYFFRGRCQMRKKQHQNNTAKMDNSSSAGGMALTPLSTPLSTPMQSRSVV